MKGTAEGVQAQCNIYSLQTVVRSDEMHARVLQDGEVESFMRLPIAEVADLVANTDEFKDNCNLVIIDFLIRHGHIVPEQPGYLALLAGMRQGDCS